MPLDCSKCDAPCCRHVKSDLLDRGDGVCKWLDQKQGICRIYDDRPTICNVDKYYDEHNLKRFMSKEEWYDINNECCEKLRQLDSQKAL